MDTFCELSVKTRKEECKILVNERYKIYEDWDVNLNQTPGLQWGRCE